MYEKQPWLKFYGKTPVSLDYPDDSIFEMLKKNCVLHPDCDALVFFGIKTSRAALLKRVEHMSRRFAKTGIQKGDMVIICLPNMPQAVIAIYALNRLGAIPAPIHPLSATPEIESYAKLVSAKTAITVDGFFPRFSSLIESSVFEKIILCSLVPEMNTVSKIGFLLTTGRKIKPVKYTDRILSWARLEADTDVQEIKDPDPIKADELALILFSGGTTSEPKAIMISNRNCNALALQMYHSGGPWILGDKILSILPVFHGFGLVVGIHSALMKGGVCILIPKFSAASIASLVKKHKPNYMAGVPTLYDALASDKNFRKVPMASFKGLFCGGDSLSPEIKKRFEAVLRKGGSSIVLREGYGLTETVTACCIVPENEYRERSIGIPCPDVLFKVVKMGTQDECGVMEEGEICITGPTLMLGYFKDKEATDEVLIMHKDGKLWLHTGDIGCMDKDGFFYFRQRAKRVIKTSGIAVYPSHIEDVLNKHPAVQLSCVIGIPHETKVEVPKAFIKLKEGFSANDFLKQEILNKCKDMLMPYSRPKAIEFIDQIPMTRVGKVAFRELEELEKQKQKSA